MQFELTLSDSRKAEVAWAFQVIADRLGLTFKLSTGPSEHPILDSAGRRLTIRNEFIKQADANWLELQSLPRTPLEEWDLAQSQLAPKLCSNRIPILFGQGKYTIDPNGNATLDLDVVGSTFFMLSRYEELVHRERDRFGRYPSKRSIAVAGQFQDRPLVDEYIEILRSAMRDVWPELQFKELSPRTSLSCDVDLPLQTSAFVHRWPLSSFISWPRRTPQGKDIDEATRNAWETDPMNTFDPLMDLAEAYGHRIEFYFLSNRMRNWKHGYYLLNHPFLLELLQKIDSRGHRIGLHGSFETYKNEQLLSRQRAELQNICEELGIHQTINRNRQHYLQFDMGTTPAVMESAGLSIDSSGGYAEQPGFRFGTCHPFRMWDWQSGQPSAVVQQPLVLMECSVLSDTYMGKSYDEDTVALMLSFRDKCVRVGGVFSLLWHNSNLNDTQDWSTLETLLKQP